MTLYGHFLKCWDQKTDDQFRTYERKFRNSTGLRTNRRRHDRIDMNTFQNVGIKRRTVNFGFTYEFPSKFSEFPSNFRPSSACAKFFFALTGSLRYHETLKNVNSDFDVQRPPRNPSATQREYLCEILCANCFALR